MRAQSIAAVACVAIGWCVPCPAAQAYAEAQTTAQTTAYLQFVEQGQPEADRTAEDSNEGPLPQTADEAPTALFAAAAALAGAAAARAALGSVAHLENSQHTTRPVR